MQANNVEQRNIGLKYHFYRTTLNLGQASSSLGRGVERNFKLE
jgi:hypothetical protein